LDPGNTALSKALDEVDTFRVSCENEADDDDLDERGGIERAIESRAGSDPGCTLVLRQYGDRQSQGEVIASGVELNAAETIDFNLSRAPILDRNGNESLDRGDIVLGGMKNTALTSADKRKTVVAVTPKGSGSDEDDLKLFYGSNGFVTVTVESRPTTVGTETNTTGLRWGDEFTISYRGIDPDPAPSSLVGVPSPSGRQVSATSWTFEIDITRPDRYAVTATVEDANFNQGTGGVANPKDADATRFEIDNELAGGEDARTIPAHDAAGNTPVSISEPFFIELYWDGSEEDGYVAGNEAGEYPGDSSKTVTLTKATLDGTDVLTSAIRQTAGSWRIGVEGMTLGEHTLKYNAEDVLGNSSKADRTLTFTVQAVPSWDLGLTAGMNLISLPSDPANSDVNAVFGDTDEIELVFTFEGSQSKVAIRNQDTGAFVGTLQDIDARHAYWISTSNAATVEISIPPTSQLAPPPFISVKGGQWNLVPVMSLGAVDDDTKGEGAAPGTEVDADSYLGDFRTGFGWTGRSWKKIDPDGPTTDTVDRLETGSVLRVGMGYWVLYNEDSIITP
jgi:hypothetical protein